MPDVLLATCAELPGGDDDDAAFAGALERLGIDTEWAVWTDPAICWDDAFVVLRSVWDYPRDLDRFLQWMAGLDHVANPVDVVGWNTDKAYLRELTAAGVPIVPTTFAAPGEPLDLPTEGDFVVKPSVGAGSLGAGRFAAADADAARAHAGRLHSAGRTILLQPYLADVDSAGESALVYFDGAFSHAIRKGPMLGDTAHPHDAQGLYVEETITARQPGRAELEVGRLALQVVRDRFGADQLYTRVDLLPSPDGPVVIELELTEPSLFLTHSAGAAAEVFATALAARL